MRIKEFSEPANRLPLGKQVSDSPLAQPFITFLREANVTRTFLPFFADASPNFSGAFRLYANSKDTVAAGPLHGPFAERGQRAQVQLPVDDHAGASDDPPGRFVQRVESGVRRPSPSEAVSSRL